MEDRLRYVLAWLSGTTRQRFGNVVLMPSQRTREERDKRAEQWRKDCADLGARIDQERDTPAQNPAKFTH